MANKTTLKKLSQGYGYKYTELSDIHDEMERQGIVYWQETKWDEGAQADYIFTHLKYGESEWEPPRRGVKVIDTAGGGMNAAQAQGSGVTYARRYSLLLALGWATEDDDGASSGKAQPKNASAGPSKPWDKYKSGSSDKEASDKQLGLIKHLLKEGGANEQAVVDYMAKITTSASASKAITELKARLGEIKDEEPAPTPSDNDLAEFGGDYE